MKKISIIFAALFVLAAFGNRAVAQCSSPDCSVTITGSDAYSDGWSGNTVTLTQGSTTLGSFTILEGGSGSETYPLCTSDGPVTVTWTSGTWPSDVSFTITDAMGLTLFTCTNGGDLYDGIIAILEPCPACPSPINLSAAASATSATISWTEIGMATQWYYSYNTVPVPGDDWVYASDNMATLVGLSPSTDYYFFVRSYCGATDSSAIASFSFRTECGGITLPYTMGFETYNYATGMPDCWKKWETASSYGYEYPQLYTYQAHTGSNSIYFYPPNGDQSIVSPKMPIAANSLEVQFWAQCGDQLQVGYITTSDLNSAVFHLVAAVGPTTYDASTYNYAWEQFTIPFDTVTTTDSIWVVFRTASTFDYNYNYLDDILFRAINNCPIPTNITATSNASHQVTLNWTCPTGSQWEIYYGPKGFDPDTASPMAVANSTTFTFTDLDNGTLYDFYVRTLCGSQASYWPLPVTAMPYPYIVTNATDTVALCDRTITDAGGPTGNFDLYTNQMFTLRAPNDDQTVHIHGNAILGNGSAYSGDENRLRIYDGDTSGQLLVNVYNEDVYDIDVTGETGALTFWFTGAEYSYYLDEGFQFYVTCVDRPDCTSPYGLTISNVAGSSAQISWSYNPVLGLPEGFTLMVLDDEGTVVSTVPLGPNDRYYLLTGLDQRTFYTVALAVDCDGTDTVRASFMTKCNNGGELQIGEQNSTSEYVPVNTYYGNSLTQQIFTASEMNGEPHIYGVQFNMTSTGTADRLIEIYMDTTSLDFYSSANDYIPVSHRYFNGAVHFENGWVNIDFDSAFAVPTNANIVMTVNDHTGSYVSTNPFEVSPDTLVRTMYSYRDGTAYDPTSSTPFGSYTPSLVSERNNVKFLVACSESSCVPPIMDQVVVGQTTVDLTWLPGNNESSWRVDYRHIDSTNWVTAATNITTPNYTLTGLSTATSYRIRVYSLCGPDDESFVNVSVTTRCGFEPVPFTEGFENFSASGSSSDPFQQCWDRGCNYAYYSYPYIDTWTAGYNSPLCMSFSGYRSYLVLPEFATSIDSLSINFFVTTTGYDYYGDAIVQVGACSDATDTNTFVVLNTQMVPCTESGWTEVDVDLDNYTPTPGDRIFIRCGNSNYAYMYVDSITVSLLPDCRRVNVEATTINATSAVLTITDNHNVGNYSVSYNTVNDIATATTLNVTTTTVLIDNLDENTPYFVWVRANCSPSSSSKFTPMSFRTACNTPFVITEDNIYTQELESGILDCMWQPESNTVMWSNQISSYNAHAYSGGHMAGLTASYETEHGMLVLPDFSFAQLTENAHLNFYRYLYCETYNNPPAATLEVYYRVGNTGDWTLLTRVDSTKNTWQKIRCVLPSSMGASLYQIAFAGSGMNYSNGIYIDDIVVRPAPSCAVPENIAVSNVTERTATVSWTGNASSYKVQYRPVGTISWNARTVEGANSIVISPLEMASDYQVRVIGICSPYDQSDPSDVFTFTTEFCENHSEANNYAATDPVGVSAVAPANPVMYCSYTEILFDSATLAGMSNIDGFSFNVNTVGGGTYLTNCMIYMSHTTANTMSGFLYDTNFVEVFSGDISYTTTGARRVLFTQPFEWDGSHNVILAFYHYAISGTAMDSTKFNAHQASTNKLYYGGSNSYFTPDQANMISAANRGASNMVPDITFFGCNPVCYEPVVSRVNTTANSIEVVWYNENASVQIAIKPSSETVWDNAVFVDDTNRFTFENLTSMTQFDIRLRRDCSLSDIGYSDWVTLTAFTDTSCSIPEGLIVTDVSATTATFSWNDGPMSSNVWELHVWNNNFNNYYTVTSNPVTIDDLIPSSNYRAAVRAHCGSNDHVVGEWSDDLVFDNVCYPVSGLQAQINGNDVVLTWNPGERNQSWVVTYGYAGFDLNDQLGYMIVNTNSATISGLAAAAGMTKGSAGTTFGFRVRAICADGWNSTWSSEASVHFVGIDDVEGADAQVSLQPNPATELVNLHIVGLEGKAMVSVISVDGRQLQRFETADSDLGIDVSNMAAGTYFVRVQTAEWTAVRKLIVK
ncbi:MAG: fibronectin type III domain-containing protein [Bacteroidales bacterium]|nr:fibronectin type III domain-containing protein [Bacteroidales bacterium]